MACIYKNFTGNEEKVSGTRMSDGTGYMLFARYGKQGNMRQGTVGVRPFPYNKLSLVDLFGNLSLHMETASSASPCYKTCASNAFA